MAQICSNTVVLTLHRWTKQVLYVPSNSMLISSVCCHIFYKTSHLKYFLYIEPNSKRSTKIPFLPKLVFQKDVPLVWKQEKECIITVCLVKFTLLKSESYCFLSQSSFRFYYFYFYLCLRDQKSFCNHCLLPTKYW